MNADTQWVNFDDNLNNIINAISSDGRAQLPTETKGIADCTTELNAIDTEFKAIPTIVANIGNIYTRLEKVPENPKIIKRGASHAIDGTLLNAIDADFKTEIGNINAILPAARYTISRINDYTTLKNKLEINFPAINNVLGVLNGTPIFEHKSLSLLNGIIPAPLASKKIPINELLEFATKNIMNIYNDFITNAPIYQSQILNPSKNLGISNYVKNATQIYLNAYNASSSASKNRIPIDSDIDVWIDRYKEAFHVAAETIHDTYVSYVSLTQANAVPNILDYTVAGPLFVNDNDPNIKSNDDVITKMDDMITLLNKFVGFNAITTTNIFVDDKKTPHVIQIDSLYPARASYNDDAFYLRYMPNEFVSDIKNKIKPYKNYVEFLKRIKEMRDFGKISDLKKYSAKIDDLETDAIDKLTRTNLRDKYGQLNKIKSFMKKWAGKIGSVNTYQIDVLYKDQLDRIEKLMQEYLDEEKRTQPLRDRMLNLWKEVVPLTKVFKNVGAKLTKNYNPAKLDIGDINDKIASYYTTARAAELKNNLKQLRIIDLDVKSLDIKHVIDDFDYKDYAELNDPNFMSHELITAKLPTVISRMEEIANHLSDLVDEYNKKPVSGGDSGMKIGGCLWNLSIIIWGIIIVLIILVFWLIIPNQNERSEILFSECESYPITTAQTY
jgi:hypothetical protein